MNALKGRAAALTRLNRVDLMARIDASGMRHLLQTFSSQMEEATRLALQLPLPRIARPRQALVAGMGGSAIGGDLARVWELALGGIPIQVNRGYQVPHSVGRGDLLIASSYSGNTEETLASYTAARRQGLSIIAITTGGKLERLARRDQIPCLILPGGLPPRAALGFSGLPILVLLWRLRAGPSPLAQIREATRLAAKLASRYAPEIPWRRNPAKQLAACLIFRFPFIYGSQDRFDIVALRFKCQLAENSKMLSSFASLPEMNHNEIEGWEVPDVMTRDQRIAVILHDRGDHPRIRRRMKISGRLIYPQCTAVLNYKSTGSGLLARLMSLIVLGDYASYYAAVARNVDPTPVASITRIKTALGAAAGP